MSRIKLLDTSLAESTSRMGFELVLESAENAMAEFAELAKQNEQLVIVDIPDDIVDAQLDTDINGIDDSLEVTRVGINAVNALNDTRLLIAPEIVESTRQDIMLVRQVATTAAAGMGIDPSELLPENMDNTVGQPMSLNMEGFKDKAIAAISAIWRFIRNICDFAISIFKVNFNRVKIRLARLIALAGKLPSISNQQANGARLEQLGGTKIETLSPNGGFPQSKEELHQMVDNLAVNLYVMSQLTGKNSVTLFKNNGRLDLVGIHARHTELTKLLGDAFNIVSKSGTSKEGDALVVISPVGGSRLVIANGVAAQGKATSDVLGKTQLDWVTAPFNIEDSTCPVLDGVDLRLAAEKFLESWTNHITTTKIVSAINVLQIEQREMDAEAKAYEALLTQTDDDKIIAYITEIVAMRRSLMTYRYSAFAQFTRTASDVLDGMYNYLDRSMAYYKSRK